jgi:hypothetical protein
MRDPPKEYWICNCGFENVHHPEQEKIVVCHHCHREYKYDSKFVTGKEINRKENNVTEHKLLDVWITWTCPQCGDQNVDNPSLTAAPVCGDCGQDYDWEEITKESICSCQVEKEN